MIIIVHFYSTQFTKVPRYTYWDRDYSFSKEDEATKSSHKENYASYLQQKRSERLWREKEK